MENENERQSQTKKPIDTYKVCIQVFSNPFTHLPKQTFGGFFFWNKLKQ